MSILIINSWEITQYDGLEAKLILKKQNKQELCKMSDEFGSKEAGCLSPQPSVPGEKGTEVAK